MGLMDSIGRGLSAAAYAGADLYARGALADQQAAIQLERDKRLEEAGIRAEGRGLENRAAERKAVFGETVENAPALRDIKTEDFKATEKAKYDPEIQALANKAKTEALTAEEQSKLDFYNNNKTGLINQRRELARAGHIDDGAGLRAVQIEAANLTLSEKKEVNALIREAETTTDPVRKAQIMQSLTTRGVIKSNEYNTEEVVTEKTNPDGSISKTKSIQKRKPDGAKSDAVVPDGPWAKYGKQDATTDAVKPSKAPNRPQQSSVATGDITYSKNPMDGTEVYTVDGIRGRFETRADAEAAKRKAGVGLPKIQYSGNPMEGTGYYTVEGVRGRFKTKADAEAAQIKSGI